METGQMFMTQMPTMATVAMAAATPTLPMMAEDASGIDFAAVLQSVAPVIAGDNQATAIAENKPVVMQQMPETAVKPALLQAIAIAVQPEITLETAAPFSGLPVGQTKKSDDLIEKEATVEPAAGLPQEVALDAAGAQLAQALQLSGRMPEPELSEESDSKSQSAVTSSKETSQQAQMQQVREAYSQPVVNKPVSAVTAPEAAPTALKTEQFATFDPSGLSEKSAGTEQTVVHVANAVQEAPVHEIMGAYSQPVAVVEQPKVEVAAAPAPAVEAPKPQAVTTATAAPVVEAPKLQEAPTPVVVETPVKPVVVAEQPKVEITAAPTPTVEAPKPQAVATSAPVVEAPKLQAAAATVVAETQAKPVVAAEQPKVEVQAAAPAPVAEATKPQTVVTTAAPVVEVPKLQASAPVVAETPEKPVVAAEQPKVEVQAATPAPVVEAPKPQVTATATAAPVVEAQKLQAAAPVVAETPVNPVVATTEQTKTTQVTQQTHETQKLPVTQQQFMEAYSKPVAKPAVIARAEAQTVVPPANAVMQTTESVALDTVEPVTKTATLAVAVETAGTNSGVPSSVVKNDVSATVTSETKAGNPQLLTQSDAALPVTLNVPSEPIQAAEVTTGTKRVAESGAVPVRIATKGSEQIREERSVPQTESVTSAKSAAGSENLISAALKEPSSVFQEDGSTQENPLFDQKMTGHLQHVSPQSSNPAVSTAVAAIPEQTQPATLSEHVVKQVNERIAAHEIKSGTDQIVLRLSPENMGEVKVNLRMENQKLTVEIVTDNKAVTDALRQNSDSLKETLAKQNIKMESFDVSTGGNSDNLAGRSNRNLNEWQEMARNKQANQWQQGGYAIPKVAVVDNAPALASYRSNGLVDVHY